MDALGVDQETMRRLGYETVDWIIDQLARAGDRPVLNEARVDDLRGRLAGPAPAEPHSLSELLSVLDADVLPFAAQWGHPRFFAYIPGSGTWPAALGDFITSAINVDASTWREAAGATQLELTVIDWFKEWVGYPAQASGILTSGGSVANLTALACAREISLGAMSDRAIVYVSDQTHSSLAKGARILGFRPDQVRVLPTDKEHRLQPDVVAAAAAADRARGLQPIALCAAAGSTSTGMVDALPELAEVAKRFGLWLHVDAAYGGFAALTERGRALLQGIELADSITLDPHKWLYQPFECGAVLVREGSHLARAFRITPHYLKDAEEADGRVNFSNRGIQLTRASRALKVWLSVSYFGVDAFRATIDRCLDLAAYAQGRIESDARFELLAPATLGVVCFRRIPEAESDEGSIEAANAAIVRTIAESGDALISSTRLAGRYSLRICVFNHGTQRADVDAVLDHIAAIEPGLPESLGSTVTRDERLGPGWLASVERLDHPLLATLNVSTKSIVLDHAWRLRATDGEVLVRAWDDSRELYLVLEGEVVVERDGVELNRLHGGDFFGELAAMDWGAGYSYPRLATVTASGEADLLVIPSAVINQASRLQPELASMLDAAVRNRLPTVRETPEATR